MKGVARDMVKDVVKDAMRSGMRAQRKSQAIKNPAALGVKAAGFQ